MNAYTRVGVGTSYLRGAIEANRRLIDVARRLQEAAASTGEVGLKATLEASVEHIARSLEQYSALVDHATREAS